MYNNTPRRANVQGNQDSESRGYPIAQWPDKPAPFKRHGMKGVHWWHSNVVTALGAETCPPIDMQYLTLARPNIGDERSVRVSSENTRRSDWSAAH